MTRSPRLVIFALLAALTLSACRADTPSGSHGSAPAMSLKIYTVNPAQTQTLLHALHEVLNGAGKFASPAPGKLLVYAPDSAQASIRRAIDTLEQVHAGMASRQTVDVHFWVVDGIAGAGKNDAALRGLSPTLKPLRQSIGPMHFKLHGSASLMTTMGKSGSRMLLGNGMVFQAKAAQLPGKQIDMHIEFSGSTRGASARKQKSGQDARLHWLRTEIAVTPGQYIVLAQSPGTANAPAHGHGSAASATSGPPQGAGEEAPTGLRLLVMRVTDTNAAR